jgi:hypothetical protein
MLRPSSGASTNSVAAVLNRIWLMYASLLISRAPCRPNVMDLLYVLDRLIALQPVQADLLNRICAGPLRSAEELRAAGAFTLPEVMRASKRQGKNEK